MHNSRYADNFLLDCENRGYHKEQMGSNLGKYPEFPLVFQHQQLEGTLVAALRTFHQLLINFAVSHPRAASE